MNIKYWIPTLVGLVLSISAVEAFADSDWYYDEGTDTIVFSYSGNPVIRSASPSEVKHTGAWHYDEGSDSIVFNGNGSRDQYARTGSSSGGFELDYNLAFLDQ